MWERSKLDVRGFESPKLPKQAKYIYGFVTKNHGLYNKKSPIKSDFFAVTSFLHNHYGGRRWIRTIEAKRNRFTVCPLWPLGNPSMLALTSKKYIIIASRKNQVFYRKFFFEIFISIFLVLTALSPGYR